MFDIAARACQAGTNAVFAEPISPKIFYMAGVIESWGRGIDKIRMGLSAAPAMRLPRGIYIVVADGVTRKVAVN